MKKYPNWRRIMNSSFNKIQEILSKDIFLSELSNKPFDFNVNNSFESNRTKILCDF